MIGNALEQSKYSTNSTNERENSLQFEIVKIAMKILELNFNHHTP